MTQREKQALALLRECGPLISNLARCAHKHVTPPEYLHAAQSLTHAVDALLATTPTGSPERTPDARV